MGLGGQPCPKPERHRVAKKAKQAKAKLTRREVVKAVYFRDGYKCRACGGRTSLHPHEIVYRSHGGDPNDPSNVVALCRDCHLDRGVHGGVGGRHLEILGTNADERLGFRYLKGEHKRRIFYSDPVHPRRSAA